MSKTILVVGGTGMLGEPVARGLQADGWSVRILTRSRKKAEARFGPPFQIVEGDVGDPQSLRNALEGCQGVHINLNGGPTADDYDRVEHLGTANVAMAAAEARVERLTYLSGISASPEHGFFPPTGAKLKAAEAIAASGVPYTIFRATWFFESLKFFVGNGRAEIIGQQPNPLHWLAVTDYVRMVSTAYGVAGAAGKTLDILGPEPLTMMDALTRYCAVRHPELTPRVMPFDEAERLAKQTDYRHIAGILPLMRFVDQFHEHGNPNEANRLLGAPTTTLDEWLRNTR